MQRKKKTDFLRDMKWVNVVLAMLFWWLIKILFTKKNLHLGYIYLRIYNHLTKLYVSPNKVHISHLSSFKKTWYPDKTLTFCVLIRLFGVRYTIFYVSGAKSYIRLQSKSYKFGFRHQLQFDITCLCVSYY